MKEIGGCFAELSFYGRRGAISVDLVRLAERLVGNGGQYAGVVRAHVGPGIQRVPFQDITDEYQQELSVRGLDEIERLAADEDVRLTQILIFGATGNVRTAAEIVTVLGVTDAAASIDVHPISLWTDGSFFSGPVSTAQRGGASKAGDRLYRLFSRLVCELRPDYGAICVEQGLPCFADLEAGVGRETLADAYVSQNLVGQIGISRIRSLADRAYVEEVGDGLYVSSYPHFNPLKIGLSAAESTALSKNIARVIADLGR